MIQTKEERQVLDITAEVQQRVRETRVDRGVCNLLLLHTSAALTTADLDEGTDKDMLDAFSEMVPKLDYRHPHNPGHVPDHILASMIGPHLAAPVEEREIQLGAWQRIVLIEFNGPRERSIAVTVR